VFNNLKIFVEKGILNAIELKSGVTLYDSNTEAHHHAVDQKTGDIVDVYVQPELEERIKTQLLQSYEERTGHRLRDGELQIVIRGTLEKDARPTERKERKKTGGA